MQGADGVYAASAVRVKQTRPREREEDGTAKKKESGVGERWGRGGEREEGEKEEKRDEEREYCVRTWQTRPPVLIFDLFVLYHIFYIDANHIALSRPPPPYK